MSAFSTKSKAKPTNKNFGAKSTDASFFGVQAKLNIGKSNDKYEIEADKAADKIVANKQKSDSDSFFGAPPVAQKKVMNGIHQQVENNDEIQQKPTVDTISPIAQLEKEETLQNKLDSPKKEESRTSDIFTAPQSYIQNKPEEEIQPQKEEESQTKEANQKIQMSADGEANPNENLESSLNNSKGGGTPLSGNSKQEMESGFGTDFNKVRIHNDSSAVQMNKQLGSQAFANGNDVYFNAGKYNPNSQTGKHLLAHELTHTVQQGGAGIKPKLIQKAAATPVANPTTTASAGETTSLQTPTFTPSAAVATHIEEAGSRGAEINVSFGDLASGSINIKKNRDETYSTKDSRQSINLSISYLAPLQNINITPVLAVKIENNNISGYITVKTGNRLVANPAGLINAIKDHSREFGWAGININRIPNVQNTIEGGNLVLIANGIPVQLGGFVNGNLDFGIQGNAVTFSAAGTINVPNLDPVQITITKNEEGNITGEVDMAVNIANFNGSIHAAFLNGTFDIRGTVGYQTEKISGQVTLLVTDAATARNAALSQLNPEQIDQSAVAANGVPEANSGPTPGPRAMAGWGEVDFSFTDWMTGKAMVIIDNEGHVTIHGEITPPAEVELFAQRDYIKEIFTIEVRTLYGVPLVGNVFLFANIGLEALAKIGPAKIYNIKAVGTYSTDPAVFNDFSLSASLNMSMFAGLRLRAEGGLGVELLGHDIKVGVGVNALAGIRGYVDATPTIGYRETASPEAGRQGEFYINGHAEMAAQPFLALGGDLFVELDSPWWSPAADHKWTWPLGELEYPLPGELGIGADVAYVLGSTQLPEIEFAPVDFNKDKFMTDLMNDHVPATKSANAEQPADFQEGVTEGTGSETPQVTDSTGNPSAGETGTPPGANLPAHPPTPEVLAQWGHGLEALQNLAIQSQNNPMTQAQITTALAPIKTRHHFTKLIAKRKGQDWNIEAEMPNVNNRERAIVVKGVLGIGEEGNGEVAEHDEQKQKLINTGLQDLRKTQSHFLNAGKITRDEAENVAAQIKQRHTVFTSFIVIDHNNSWDYQFTASPPTTVNGAPKDLATPLQKWVGDIVRTNNTIESGFKTEAENAGYNFYNENTEIRRNSGAAETISGYHINNKGELIEGLRSGSAVPTHSNFTPQAIQVTEQNGVYTAKYGTINDPSGKTIQEFTVSLSFDNVLEKLGNKLRRQKIQGENLGLSQFAGRGTWDSANRGFHNAHLIGDRFGGTGQNEGLNIHPSSPNYNVSTMKNIEDSIAKLDQVKNNRFKMEVDAVIKEEKTSELRALLQKEVKEDEPKNFIRNTDKTAINDQENRAIAQLRIPINNDLNAIPGQFMSVDYKINDTHIDNVGPDTDYDSLVKNITETNNAP